MITHTAEQFVKVVSNNEDINNCNVNNNGDIKPASLVYDAMWVQNEIDFGKNLDPQKNSSLHLVYKSFLILNKISEAEIKANKFISRFRDNSDFIDFCKVAGVDFDSVDITYINDPDCNFDKKGNLGLSFKKYDGTRQIKKCNQNWIGAFEVDEIPEMAKAKTLMISCFLCLLSRNGDIYLLDENGRKKLNKNDGTNFIMTNQLNDFDSVICEICGKTFEIASSDQVEVCSECR